jgi:hypothetical protein
MNSLLFNKLCLLFGQKKGLQQHFFKPQMAADITTKIFIERPPQTISRSADAGKTCAREKSDNRVCIGH